MSQGAREARQRLGLRVLLHRFVGCPHARPASIFPSDQFARPKSGGAPAAVQNLAESCSAPPDRVISESGQFSISLRTATSSPWPAPPKRLLRISAQLYNSLPQCELLATDVKELVAAG